MNTRLTIALCCALLLCAFLAGQVIGQNQPAAQATPQIGRYQGFGATARGGIFVIDTSTGALYSTATGRWTQEMGPIKGR